MERVNEAIRAGDVKAPVYNLKAVVKETGLTPSTLRAWERRYGFPEPIRTAGGHRLYSQRDIDILKEMKEAAVSVSVAFNDNRTRRLFEANTMDTENRVEALHRLGGRCLSATAGTAQYPKRTPRESRSPRRKSSKSWMPWPS